MTKLVIAVIIGLASFVIVRVIAGAFGLNDKSIQLGNLISHLPKETIYSIGSVVAAIVATIAVVLWLLLHADERIGEWWTDRPALGSLLLVTPTMKVHVGDKMATEHVLRQVELAVEIKNANERLVKIEGDLRATANGKDLDQPIPIKSYIGAGSTTTLIATINDVPVVTAANGAMLLEGSLRYNIRYDFGIEKNPRRTSKLVTWQSTAPATGASFTEIRQQIFTRYFDEIEE